MVFDVLRKKKKELEVPMPPPPPVESFEFPEIPEREELSIPEPEPIPIINTKEEFERSGIRLPEPKQIKFRPEKPLFVSLDDFKKVNSNLLEIRSRIEEARDSINHLDQLYEKQQKNMESWIDELERIEKKIAQADELIKNHEKK